MNAMTMTAPLPSLGLCASVSLPEAPTLNAVAVYEDLSSAFLVNAAFAGLREGLHSALHINTFAWSFRQLERTDVRAHAFRIASAADIIVVAAHSGDGMTGHVNQWLESCLSAHGDGQAVLTALDEGFSGAPVLAQGENRLCGSLKQVAMRWGAQFLHDDEFERRISPEFALELVGSHRRPAAASYLAPLTRARVPRHYGINE